MEQPNLAMIPSGVKATKVYSIMPESGVGDFTFARSSTAYRLNKDGFLELSASNLPRLNYDLTNGVPSQCSSLLLEPSSTNLVIQSNNFTTGGWTLSNTSVVANDITSPEGKINASKITTTNGSHTLYLDFTTTASTSYAFSFYVRRGTMTDLKYRINDLTNQANIISPTSYYSQTSNKYWERILVPFTTPSGCTSIRLMPIANTASGITGTVFLYGCQLEQKSYSTSYIPTSGSIQSRSAETCNGAGNASTFNSEEGILYAEIAALAVESSVRQLAISDGTANESVKILYLNSTQIRIELKTTSGNDFVKDFTVTTNEFQKIALQYKASNYKVFVNGVAQSVSQTSAVASGLDRINFDRGDGGNDWYGKVKDIRYYDTEGMTDTEINNLLTQLTQ